MTAATLAYLPVQVGGVALASAGRAALWVIQRYMRAPLTNTAIGALVVASAMAGSNALFGQQHAHPAPLFAAVGPVSAVAAASEDESGPVVPATKPSKLGVKTAPIVGRPVELAPAATEIPAADTGPIGNKDVFEVQRKLAMLKLFTGTIDGYYGPQTAGAIRKFEELNGLKPTGELTTETIERIKSAPLSLSEPKEPTASVARPAVTLPTAKAAPVEEDLPPPEAEGRVKPQSLAAMTHVKPLDDDINTGSVGKKPAGTALLGRPVPSTPEAALEMAAATAGDAIDTIVSGVEAVAMNRSGRTFGPAQSYASETKPLGTTVAPAQVAALPDGPKVGVPLKINDEPAKPGTQVAVLDTQATPEQIAPISVSDPVIVAKVQRGLASLGFLHGPADGIAGEATAKAIRNFETYFNYDTTGRITPELLNLLVENGAAI